MPTGKGSALPEAGGGRGAGGNAGIEEHRFVVMALDRLSGKPLWQQTAATAIPHEGYHRIYGSFASNNPATDGRQVYVFLGSHGLFAYDMNGKQIWKRDFNQRMKMHLQFGEESGGRAPRGQADHGVRSQRAGTARRDRRGDGQAGVERPAQ